MQVGMALTPNSLARRKPGVQIPSPPPPNLAGQSVASVEPAALTACWGRGAAASASRSPARKARSDQATRPWTFHVTTERGRRLQPEHASAATPDSPEQKPPWLKPMVVPFADTEDGQTRALLAVWLPAAPTRSMKSPVQTPRTRTRTRGHPTPGHRDVHPRTLDSRCVDTGRSPGHRTPDTGHRTPDTGHRTRGRDRVLGQGHLGTAAPDRHPGPPRPPDCRLGRRTVDLWTAPAAPGNDEGSATVRYLPARDYLQHYQAPARSLRRPSRALAHCSPRTISGRK
jgi:hypothetical protein